MGRERYRHILLSQSPAEEAFTSTGSGGREPRIPERDRQAHSDFLFRRLQAAWKTAEGEQAVTHVTRKGIYLEFKSEPGFDLMTKSLEDRRSPSRDKQIRLLNVREEYDPSIKEEVGRKTSALTFYATVCRLVAGEASPKPLESPNALRSCCFDYIAG